MSHLIDTTEMYLKTVFEMEEDGVAPLRARIVERLDHSGPTVSQTVARIERDGLLRVGRDRRIQLTEAGREKALAVIRKHRLAERLLMDTLDMPIETVNAEACRWEHVMSEFVTEKVSVMLGNPTHDPFGNVIPGSGAQVDPDEISAADAVDAYGKVHAVKVSRLGEPLQDADQILPDLLKMGVLTGKVIDLKPEGQDVVVCGIGMSVQISGSLARHLFVTISDRN